MKPCFTCEKNPIKNGIYQAHLEKFAEKNLPKTNKQYHNTGGKKIHIQGLKPNHIIFYFATNERDFTKSIKQQTDAYNKLENSGVTKTDSNGEANVFLKCPQLYVNDDGEVYSRHFHFIYWNEKNGVWDKNLFTQQILCNVDWDFVHKYDKKAVVIDARPNEYYEKSHYQGAINMPFNKRWNEENVIAQLKNYKGDKMIPLILYCAKGCDAANKLYHKLDKLGFHNTMHAE